VEHRHLHGIGLGCGRRAVGASLTPDNDCDTRVSDCARPLYGLGLLMGCCWHAYSAEQHSSDDENSERLGPPRE